MIDKGGSVNRQSFSPTVRHEIEQSRPAQVTGEDADPTHAKHPHTHGKAHNRETPITKCAPAYQIDQNENALNRSSPSHTDHATINCASTNSPCTEISLYIVKSQCSSLCSTHVALQAITLQLTLLQTDIQAHIQA